MAKFGDTPPYSVLAERWRREQDDKVREKHRYNATLWVAPIFVIGIFGGLVVGMLALLHYYPERLVHVLSDEPNWPAFGVLFGFGLPIPIGAFCLAFYVMAIYDRRADAEIAETNG